MEAGKIQIGVVGLGLMGCSIATCLLMSGHPVVAIAPIPMDMETAELRIRKHLNKAKEEGLVAETAEFYLGNLMISEEYGNLKLCQLVIECTIENEEIKRSVYGKIEAEIGEDALRR